MRSTSPLCGGGRCSSITGAAPASWHSSSRLPRSSSPPPAEVSLLCPAISDAAAQTQKDLCTEPGGSVTLQLDYRPAPPPSASCPAGRSRQVEGGGGAQDILQSELDSSRHCPPTRHHLEEQSCRTEGELSGHRKAANPSRAVSGPAGCPRGSTLRDRPLLRNQPH